MSKREEIMKAAAGFRYLDSEQALEQEGGEQQEEAQPLGLRNILAMAMRMAYAEEGVFLRSVKFTKIKGGVVVEFTGDMHFTPEERNMILAEGPSGPNTGPVAGGEEVARLIGEQAHRAIEQRHVDLLALARARPHQQRRLHAVSRPNPGRQIADRDAHLHRMPGGFAGQRHQPAHPLRDEIVSRLMRPRPGLAEAGDGAIDQPRIDGREAGVIEPELGKAAGLEVLDHHIGVGAQGLHPVQIVGAGEIRDDRALPPVAGVVIGRLAVDLALRVGALDPRRAPQARAITLGAFDLDHVRAPRREHRAGRWHEPVHRDLEDADPFEWPAHDTTVAHVFDSRNSSSPAAPISRPIPDCL